jgi:hypothetical protein
MTLRGVGEFAAQWRQFHQFESYYSRWVSVKRQQKFKPVNGFNSSKR